MNHKTRRGLISLIASGALATLPIHNAIATGAIAGATEPTQMLNNIELVQQVLQSAQQLATEIQSYNNLVQNTLNIPNQVWTTIQSDLGTLANVVQQGQALAYTLSNVGTQFQTKYPGYKPTINFPTDYKNWSTTFRDTLKGTLEAVNLQSQQFSTEEQAMKQLRAMSASAQGRMQAIQVGNQIAGETVAQLQKLRALAMAQMQSQNAYMAKQEQEKDTVKANVDGLLKTGSLKYKAP
jgi:P-type conjugative transfer protein TrbJ